MNVLQVMFSKGVGGLERAFVDHAAMLMSRGHAVHCIIPKHAPVRGQLAALRQRQSGSALGIHEVENVGWRRLLLPIQLRDLTRSIAPDVIVTHGAKAVGRMRRAAGAATPVIGITHNASPRLREATHLIALTQALRQHFIQAGFDPQRIWTVPNALPLTVASLPRRALNHRDPLVIGVLGRWVHKKGVDIFLRGFKLALEQGLAARALIAGDGPERANLKHLRHHLRLERDVDFIGWVTDTHRFYERIDVCCVPSRDEPFGLVILEAFAHGVPVLASAVGGPADLIVDGENGALFTSEDPEALALGLIKLADREQRERLRNAAYTTVQRYHPDAVAVQLEAALDAAFRAFALGR